MAATKKSIRLFYSLWAVFCFFQTRFLFPQEKEINLPEFYFQDSKQNKNFIFKKNVLDTHAIEKINHQSLSDLFSTLNTFYIKNYGQGGIASASARGASAQQSSVIWNGININSPSLGMCDLSLVPIHLFEEINLIQGAESQIYGSGTSGSVIELNNTPFFRPKTNVSIQTNYSSLLNSNTGFNFSKSQHNFHSKTSFQFSKNENNFNYKNQEGNIKNFICPQSMFGLVQDFYYLMGKSQLHTSIWIQNANRENPVLISQTKTQGSQQDFIGRYFTSWKRQVKKGSISISFFHQKEKLNYFNYNSDNPNKNSTRNSNLESVFSTTIKRQALEFTQGLNLASSQNESPTTNNMRAQVYAYGQYRLTTKKESISIGIRNDYYLTKQNAFTYHVFINHSITSKTNIYLQHNKLFRIPTLNDLFWNPGGNIHLKPETGLNLESGIRMKSSNNKASISCEGMIYFRKMENLIVWLPNEGQIWQAKNIHSSNHYGSETKTEMKWILQKDLKAGLNFSTAYNVAYRTTRINIYDQGAFQQFMYCPMYSGSAIVFFQINNFFIGLRQIYTGYRYTSEDRRNYLPPYNVTNLNLNYSLTGKNVLYKINFSALNLFNEMYQSVSQYAMPGRNFQIGIQITYNKK